MLNELYVYYRVRPDAAEQVREQVEQLQTELRARWPDLTARSLLRAPDATGGSDIQTWMEIYTRPAGLSEQDQAIVLARGSAIVRSIDGPRHAEVFAPCA